MYDYDVVKRELKEVVVKKRAEILAMAKEKVFTRILQECQVLGLKTKAGQLVPSKSVLKKWLKESHATNEQFLQITERIWKESAWWNEDMSFDLHEQFGIKYNPKTITPIPTRRGMVFLKNCALRR